MLAQSHLDDEVDLNPVVQRLVPALACEPLQPLGPTSIFGLAETAQALWRNGRFGNAAGFETSTPGPTVKREPGVIRVVGARYPDNRWTEEKEERERERRARQIVPRPTGRVRTRGKKVRAWDGESG